MNVIEFFWQGSVITDGRRMWDVCRRTYVLNPDVIIPVKVVHHGEGYGEDQEEVRGCQLHDEDVPTNNLKFRRFYHVISGTVLQ